VKRRRLDFDTRKDSARDRSGHGFQPVFNPWATEYVSSGTGSKVGTMAARFVRLGLDDQSMYILSRIAFALMYGLRPFISKLQRPKDR
jgi:hypothetical protein